MQRDIEEIERCEKEKQETYWKHMREKREMYEREREIRGGEGEGEGT